MKLFTLDNLFFVRKTKSNIWYFWPVISDISFSWQLRISVKHNASISTWYLSFLKSWRSLLNYLMFSNGTVKQQVLTLTILSSIQQLLSLNLRILKFNFCLLQNYGYKFQVNVNCLYQWLVYISKLFISVNCL